MKFSHILILFCLLIEANNIIKPKNSKNYNLNKNEYCLAEDFGSKIGLSKKKEEKYSTKNSLYGILSKSAAFSADFQNLP